MLSIDESGQSSKDLRHKSVADSTCHAMQVQGQLKLIPEKLHGYMYSVGSLLSGALLGVVVYGPMVWTS